MAIKEGLEYLSKRHDAKQAARAERARQAAIRREEERQRRETERQELLARLTQRFQKQFSWEMEVTDYFFDAWGDPVYRLDDGTYITISERNPLSYRKKAQEDPFRNFHEELRLGRMKEEIKTEILRETRARKDQASSSG
jgi:hypothetical protein